MGELLSAWPEPEMQLVRGGESFPPVRCTVLGGVVASVKEGPSSQFRATQAVCSSSRSSREPPHPPSALSV